MVSPPLLRPPPPLLPPRPVGWSASVRATESRGSSARAMVRSAEQVTSSPLCSCRAMICSECGWWLDSSHVLLCHRRRSAASSVCSSSPRRRQPSSAAAPAASPAAAPEAPAAAPAVMVRVRPAAPTAPAVMVRVRPDAPDAAPAAPAASLAASSAASLAAATGCVSACVAVRCARPAPCLSSAVAGSLARVGTRSRGVPYSSCPSTPRARRHSSCHTAPCASSRRH